MYFQGVFFFTWKKQDYGISSHNRLNKDLKHLGLIMAFHWSFMITLAGYNAYFISFYVFVALVLIEDKKNYRIFFWWFFFQIWLHIMKASANLLTGR